MPRPSRCRGSNLQKFIVGREIEARPRCSSSRSPPGGWTWGRPRRFAAKSSPCAERAARVLVVSEELDELFELCDRLYVIARGRLSPSVPVAEASVERIGEWMSGLWPQAEEARHAAA